MRRLLVPGLLIAASLAASPALACKIAPPDMTSAGRAEAAQRERIFQAQLDRAEAVYVAQVGGTPSDLGAVAVTVRPLRGTPPARTSIGPSSTCDPVWKGGDRLIVYANRVAGRWSTLRIEPDTPVARAAVRRR